MNVLILFKVDQNYGTFNVRQKNYGNTFFAQLFKILFILREVFFMYAYYNTLLIPIFIYIFTVPNLQNCIWFISQKLFFWFQTNKYSLTLVWPNFLNEHQKIYLCLNTNLQGLAKYFLNYCKHAYEFPTGLRQIL